MHEDDQDHIHLGSETDPAVYLGEHLRLRSAGIDIGSSTSHLVFSDLVLVRQGRQLSSQYQVTQREVRFRSRVILVLARQLDRKSTRLNSSHSSISYAVFCLKKKKKKKNKYYEYAYYKIYNEI